MSDSPIRILIADDEEIILQGLKVLLGQEPGLEIVGDAANGQAALQQIEVLQPDIVLMDVRMPIMDGVTATQEVCQRFPTTKVMMLTTLDTDELVTQALQYGASGYLLKNTPPAELAQAIQLAHRGYLQVGPGVGQKVVRQLSAPRTGLAGPGLEEAGFTPREREVLELIAQGASNREIAQALHIAEKTVKNHVSNILTRLGLRDRTQVAIWFNAHQPSTQTLAS